MKIGVVGCGFVGATAAYSLITRGIANKFKISEKELIAANKLTRSDRLQINQTLIIPSAKQETPTPSTCTAKTSQPAPAYVTVVTTSESQPPVF